MRRTVRHLPVSIAAAALVSLAAAGCGTAAGGVPPITAPIAHSGFAGYKWSVTAIEHHGSRTSIPPSYPDYLAFAPNGEFLANEPVNTHDGTYRVTDDGFTVSGGATSAVGYIGHDPVVLLSQAAIGTFSTVGPVHATATVTGNRLTVVVDGYTLICRRNGTEANFPTPAAT